jgi:enoyl-CoA hydratase
LSVRPKPTRLSPAEFGAFLVAPDAGERLSPIDGPGCVVLDLSGPAAIAGEAGRERIESHLPILPCVTVALLNEEEETPARAALAARCDVRVSDEPGLARLLAGFAETPLAALAFVQLLRGAPPASTHAGLVAESFVYSTLQSGPEFRRWLEARPRKRDRVDESEPTCRIERDRSRLDIRLSRPLKHNAFSRAMRDQLCESLQLALADPSIEEVVLSGEGPSFCSGGDLDEFGSFPDPTMSHATRMTRSPALLIAQLTGRIRSELHGACVGAGAELPAFTDHVVADEDAFFWLPEVGLGLVPGAGGSVSLTRRIGRERTAWLGLSGERIDARTALDWGLVDEVRLGQHLTP